MNERKDLDNPIIPKTVETTKSHSFYIMLLAIGFTIYSISLFQMKLIGKIFGKYDPNHFLFFRCIALCSISAIILRISNKEITPIKELKSPYSLVIRSFFNFFSNIAFLLCLNYIRLSTAVIFTSLSPIFTAGLSIVMLNEKCHKRYSIGILICLLGSFLLLMNEKTSSSKSSSDLTEIKNVSNYNFTNLPLNETINNQSRVSQNSDSNNSDFLRTLLGFFFGIIYCFCLGIQNILNKMLLNQKIENNILLFYLGAITGIFSFIASILFSGNFSNFVNFYFILQVFFNGLIYYVSSYLNNIAFIKLDVIETTGISYIITVESFFFGVVFLGESIYFTDFLGSFLIVSYNIYNAYYPIKKQ
jgi:drug/metabolite transporter (DMT)-like permease